MEFLYKIYSNPNFALGLFAVITILLILFVVVLVMAIRDTKKRNIEKLDSMEKEELSNVQSTIDETVDNNGSAFAFNLDEKNDSLEFFASEDEISKTRDITFDTPVTENSMSGLLDEFDEPEEVKEEVKVEKQPTIDELIAQVNKDEENTQNNDSLNLFNGPEDDFFDLTQIDSIKPINESETTEIDFASLQERLASSSEEVKKENLDTIIAEETMEDDFELPAMKKEEVVASEDTNIDALFATDDVEEVKISDITKKELDLEKTGVLNFSNIESESYEIK